jgi:hypothetical protein
LEGEEGDFEGAVFFEAIAAGFFATGFCAGFAVSFFAGAAAAGVFAEGF